MVRATSRIALSALMLVVASSAAHAASARLDDVKVSTEGDATVVTVHTARVPHYTAGMIDSPDRLVLDLEDTTYAWRGSPLAVAAEPIRSIRGSQYRKDRARLVIELSRRAGFVVREGEDGLAVVISAETRAPRETRSPAPAALVVPVKTAAGTGALMVAQATPPPAPAPAPTRAPAAPAPPGGQRLISLDFKDADVVNLLRILAAESGRNIVIGEDVKGRMSISLHNVPWDQALDTILEARGLVKIEKADVIRIVSTEQLTKEREAVARVEEAKLKADAEVRTKLAEAAMREADVQARKVATEAAQREQEARGPLREETIRLQYADPEEVENTLKGILGIPKEGTKPLVGVPTVLGTNSIGGTPANLLAGPPPNPDLPAFLQPGPQPMAPGLPVPTSVSQDVLNKGLTIRAHKPTNTIFLRLYERDLERVKKLIRDALDIPLPQVKIEARMEILDRTALEQIGVQWGGGLTQRAGSQVIVGQGYQTTTNLGQTVPVIPGIVTPDAKTLFDPVGVKGIDTTQITGSPTTPNPLAATLGALTPNLLASLPISAITGLPLGGNIVNLPISALPNSGPLPAAGITFGLVGSRYNINLALQALNERGKTRTLARPEIVTVENNKAAMSLGEEIPFATISSAGTQIQFKEALLKLEVTPTVIREGAINRIKMLVVVENNDRGATVNLGNAGNPPAINRRKAETLVLIQEGDRLVIGGVTTNTNSNTVRKVPFLGDIPLLGWLFKQKEDFEKGRELVVFVTPSILRPTGLAEAPLPPPAAPSTR
jgi:type IV pilus assembly protein PilQ